MWNKLSVKIIIIVSSILLLSMFLTGGYFIRSERALLFKKAYSEAARINRSMGNLLETLVTMGIPDSDVILKNSIEGEHTEGVLELKLIHAPDLAKTFLDKKIGERYQREWKSAPRDEIGRRVISDQIVMERFFMSVAGKSLPAIRYTSPIKADERCFACHDVKVGQIMGAFFSIVSLEDAFQVIKKRTRENIFLFGLGFISILFALYYSLRKIVLRPIVRISKVVKNIIENKDLSGRVEVVSGDEIGQLGMVFNKMLGSLKESLELEKQKAVELKEAYEKLRVLQDTLIQAEKMNAIGRLASGVAHEVKNPLGIIKQGIDYLEGELSLSEAQALEVIKILKESIARADNIIRTLVDFSRASKLEKNYEDVNSILDISLVLIQHRIKQEEVEIVKELGEGLPKVIVDKAKLEQVFINILLNAVDAMAGGGKLFIRSYPVELNNPGNGVGEKDEDYFRLGEKAVIVEIEDTGAGIAEEHLKKVFDPFFTTKAPGKGMGMGLSVTKNIISMHKGLIEIKSQVGKGTKVIITLKIIN